MMTLYPLFRPHGARPVLAVLGVGLCGLLLGGCKTGPTPKEQHEAQIHYDLAVNATEGGDRQVAYKEVTTALEKDPDMPEARFLMGLLLQATLRYDDAVKNYQHALKVRPNFSEAKTNLGTVYVAQGRFDEAIALYQEVLNDMAYVTPYIAQGNLGWAYFKKGEVEKAIDHIKSALTSNPKYCLGYMWLGTIYDQQGDQTTACRNFGRYREHCPDQPDAHYKEGICLAKLEDRETAAERFASCEEKASGDLKDECQKLKTQLQAPR